MHLAKVQISGWQSAYLAPLDMVFPTLSYTQNKKICLYIIDSESWQKESSPNLLQQKKTGSLLCPKPSLNTPGRTKECSFSNTVMETPSRLQKLILPAPSFCRQWHCWPLPRTDPIICVFLLHFSLPWNGLWGSSMLIRSLSLEKNLE